jgi:hypothetical protein
MVAGAQQATLPVVEYLSSQSADEDYKILTVPFLQGLMETGYYRAHSQRRYRCNKW